MSEEESSPAPLRLRPRQRPASDSLASESGAPPAPSAPPPAPTIPPPPAFEPAPPAPPEPSPAATERPRLRAKPRLSTAEDTTATPASPATAEPAVIAQPSAATAEIPPLVPVPPLATEPAEPAPLKLRLHNLQAAATSQPPPLPAQVASPPSLPPLPRAAVPSSPSPLSSEAGLSLPPPPPPFAVPDNEVKLRPPDHILPHISASLPIREIEKQTRPPMPPSASGKKKSPLRAVVIIAAVLLVTGAVFWFAGAAIYRKFFAVNVAEVAQLPVRLIDKAQAAVEDRRALEQNRIDAMGEGREAPTERAIGPAPTVTPEPTPPAPVVEGPVTTYAPSAAAAPEIQVEPSAPQPGPGFIAFVEGARIGGVFQGSPARAFINGRTVRAGETVDDRLGIVFVGLDDTRLKLIFRDPAGAEIIRKF